MSACLIYRSLVIFKRNVVANDNRNRRRRWNDREEKCEIIVTAHRPSLIMTTVDSDDDIEKLPHIQWDNTTVPGPSGCMFPGELTPLECQIAGHPFNGEKQTIGVLVCRRTGHILKPATKIILGEREIAFYESLKNSHDPVALELKKFVPRYYGTTELRVFNNRTKFLILRNITKGMAEPCVIDIKIGFRTWDPLATPEKRRTEELKYAESKRTYGFCITGYQVYSVLSGRLRKYDRDYGKQLSVEGVVEGICFRVLEEYEIDKQKKNE